MLEMLDLISSVKSEDPAWWATVEVAQMRKRRVEVSLKESVEGGGG